jgi:hypothetical protein
MYRPLFSGFQVVQQPGSMMRCQLFFHLQPDHQFNTKNQVGDIFLLPVWFPFVSLLPSRDLDSDKI